MAIFTQAGPILGTQRATISGFLGVPMDSQGYPNRSNWSKIIQNLPYLLFSFEIFEIAQDSRKLALCRQPLGVPVGAQVCPMLVS